VSATRDRSDTEHAQVEAIRRLRGPSPSSSNGDASAPTGYPGLVTRAIALAIDAAIVNGAAALVGVTTGLALSILHLPSQADVLLAAVWGGFLVIWTVAYFAFFWSSTGQTPGARTMHIAVVDARRRGSLKPRRAVVRFAALCLAAIPLLAGLLMMLWDDRGRCLQDRVARTTVVYAPSRVADITRNR
jgi:uncharacterized RDD family membrane protein YckC